MKDTVIQINIVWDVYKSDSLKNATREAVTTDNVIR